MTPLVTAPARGYTDYQRLENWDSGVNVLMVLRQGRNRYFGSA